MVKKHISATIEDVFTHAAVMRLRSRGWKPYPVAYPSFGTVDHAHISGRVLYGQPDPDDLLRQLATGVDVPKTARGWRAFITSSAPYSEVIVTLGNAVVKARSDRGGYVHVTIKDHGLPAGWHKCRITATSGVTRSQLVQIVDNTITTGIVSDIDDTVLVTHLPRPFIAAWNAFILTENARAVVPGMAYLYKEILGKQPGAPVVYLSTGAWNTVPFLTRFLRFHSYPQGAMLLTDWGPTETTWFRSAVEHKKRHLLRLAQDFPNIRWTLVGDNGQNDQNIYAEFAQRFPNQTANILIRQLSPAQKVLSSTPQAVVERKIVPHSFVPMIEGQDGFSLRGKLSAMGIL